MKYRLTSFNGLPCASQLRSPKNTRTSSRGPLAKGFAILLLLAFALPLPAQEARWKELTKQAKALRDEGNSAGAIPVAEEAVQVAEKTFGADHENLAVSLDLLGFMYFAQGKYAETELLFERSLAIRERISGADHPEVVTSLDNLTLLFDAEGKYAVAEPLFNRSLSIRENLGLNQVDLAASLNGLALLYREQGTYAEDESLLRRSLTIREKVLGPDHPDVANSLQNLAILYYAHGNYAEAETLVKRSLAIREKVLGPDHADVATSLYSLATLNYAQGNYVQAEAYFERALQNISKQFENNFTYMSEKDRLHFLDAVQSQFDVYLSFSMAYRQSDPTLVSRMYDMILWEKGAVVTNMAALRAQVAASGDTEALKIFDQLAAKKRESARLASTRPQDWKQLRSSLEGEANDLEQQLARRVSSLGEQKDLARASWRDVQQELQPGEAAVEFARFQYFDGKRWSNTFDYVALVLTSQSQTAPTLVSLGDAKDLEGEPLRDYRLRAGLQPNGSAEGVTVTPQEESIGSVPNVTFYGAFWKPLEPALTGIHRIYISTDGVLNQLALGVVTADDGHLLMEKYDIRIVSSTKDILLGPRKAANNTAVLLGNPTFDLDETPQRVALRNPRSSPADHPAPAAEQIAGLRSRDLENRELNPLPGTQAEVEAISSLLEKQQWVVRTYTQQHALEESVMEVKGPRVLHLATRGFFEPDQEEKSQRPEIDQPSSLEDPMLRSGLFFAGANRRLAGHTTSGDPDDGVLTAYDATQLNLQGTELVVLSACETGLGEVAAGEGVYDLRSALQVAGAQSVLMSMWAVPSKETQELMTLFYQKWLGGKDKHEALREAQLEMRARVKARYGEDRPRYWGTFVLVGR
jgi:CHAT domain-containing protein/tetratricopeptide (TPR) repeat protein